MTAATMDPAPTGPAPIDGGPTDGGGPRCGNCGTPLLGPHCHACGQPIKGLVRHFTSIVGDFFDSVFDLDARTWRTLGPLLLRPGYLSCEYFAGRRVRFVSPVRLFFFLCIAAFFALQLSVDLGADSNLRVGVGQGMRLDGDGFERAASVEDVERIRDEAVRGLDEARDGADAIPGMATGMQAGIDAIEARAQQRIAELQAEPSTPGAARTADAGVDGVDDGSAGTGDDGVSSNFSLPIGGKPWDPDSNPVVLAWLPDVGNAAVNRALVRIRANTGRIEDEPRLLLHAFLENLPAALLLLLPVFALLLKVFFVFKRRLYMEHLIVALHSHAFLCASLLLLAGCMGLREVLDAGFWYQTMGWAEGLLIAWMPLYLLVMQRRVYRQNWLLTVLKFGMLGIAYTVLLGLATSFALVLSLLTM